MSECPYALKETLELLVTQNQLDGLYHFFSEVDVALAAEQWDSACRNVDDFAKLGYPQRTMRQAYVALRIWVASYFSLQISQPF